MTAQEEEDAELAALNAEADMPLEQLLAMYDMVRRGAAAASAPRSDNGTDDDDSDGSDRRDTFLAGKCCALLGVLHVSGNGQHQQ